MVGNEKRALVAVLITMLLITAYSYFFLPKTHKNEPKKAVSENSSEVKTNTQAVSLENKSSAVIDEKPIKIETGNYKILISTINGSIKELTLKKYKVDNKLVNLIESSGKYKNLETVFRSQDVENIEKTTVYIPNKEQYSLNGKNSTFTLILKKSKNGITIEKTYKFINNKYDIKTSVQVYRNGKPVDEQFSIYAGPNLGDLKEGKYSHLGAVALIDNKSIKKDNKIKPDANINWVALESKYFCFALLPKGKKHIIAGYNKVDDASYIYANLSTPSHLTIYAGPKSKEIINSVDPNLDKIIRFGMFGFIGKPLLKVLNVLYAYLGNYGLAIILLTFFIRLLFYPLSFKSFKSMKAMSKLQPKLKELQVKYKGKPDKLNKATMELYKKHKVNPFGGCLPVVIQIPVFLGFYNVLLNAIELRGAPFAFWIVDLSVKDPYYILPIIMGITMFLQQKLTPTSMDPKQAKIMMFLPLIFTVMFLSFPSGLVLYWSTNNILTIIQQVFIDSKIIESKEKHA